MRSKYRFISSVTVNALCWVLTILTHNLGYDQYAAAFAVLSLGMAYDTPCALYWWLRVLLDEEIVQYPAIVTMIFSVGMATALCTWIVAGFIAACVIGFATMAAFICIIVSCWRDAKYA